MDTTEVADILGTSPRVFRQFLRSPISTFTAVGSGARYDFNESEIPTLKKRFAEWQGAGKPKAAVVVAARKSPPSKGREAAQAKRDREVWAEEGDITIEDIRDPRVRRRVKQAAQAAEDELNLRLMAAGLHITQLGDRMAS